MMLKCLVDFMGSIEFKFTSQGHLPYFLLSFSLSVSLSLPDTYINNTTSVSAKCSCFSVIYIYIYDVRGACLHIK